MSDAAARQIVVLVHGIHTSRREARTWMDQLATKIRRETGMETYQFRYGWTSGASIALPGWGWISRRGKTRRFQRFVSRLVADRPATVHVVAHSFGTWIARYSLIRGPEQLRPRIGTLLLMGGIVHRNDRFTCGRVQRVVNLHSRNDDVVRRAPGFGDCGYRGLAVDGDRVSNVDMTPANHRAYTIPGREWNAVVTALSGNA